MSGRAVGEHQARADHQPEIQLLIQLLPRLLARVAQRDMRAHHARDGVAVGDADPRHAERDRLRDHGGRMRRAVQERIIARGDELGEARAHANRPCRNQPGLTFSAP